MSINLTSVVQILTKSSNLVFLSFVDVIQKRCITSSFTLFTQNCGVIFRLPNELVVLSRNLVNSCSFVRFAKTKCNNNSALWFQIVK